MKENLLIDLSKKFAVKIINISTKTKKEKRNSILLNQLIGSGTSIGANIHEGNYAISRADFINKFQIALKECYETEYWLDILCQSNIIEKNDYDILICDCNKLRKLLTESIKTAKANSIK